MKLHSKDEKKTKTKQQQKRKLGFWQRSLVPVLVPTFGQLHFSRQQNITSLIIQSSMCGGPIMCNVQYRQMLFDSSSLIRYGLKYSNDSIVLCCNRSGFRDLCVCELVRSLTFFPSAVRLVFLNFICLNRSQWIN